MSSWIQKIAWLPLICNCFSFKFILSSVALSSAILFGAKQSTDDIFFDSMIQPASLSPSSPVKASEKMYISFIRMTRYT